MLWITSIIAHVILHANQLLMETNRIIKDKPDSAYSLFLFLHIFCSDYVSKNIFPFFNTFLLARLDL